MSREMKDSGVEWIDDIPITWQSVSLRKVLEYPITDGPHETPNYLDEGVPFISIDSLNESENIDLRVVKKFISLDDYERFNKKTQIKTGNILFTKAATIGKTAIVGNEKFMVWSPIAVIKPKEEVVTNKYIYYILSTEKFVKYASLLGTSNTQVNLGMRALEKAKMPLPTNKVEQRKITDVLDEKVQQIDSLIGKTKSTMEDYKLLKQSIISEAVSKGLNKNVEMKDSRIKWNKHIPKHWEGIGAKRLFTERKERARCNDQQLTASQKHGILPQAEFMKIENQKVVLVEKNYSILKHVEPNDFVISMRSFQGGLEYSNVRGCISSAYVMLIPDERVYAPYFKWLFKSVKYINALQATSNLVRDGQALRYGNFIQVPLFIMPIEEQREIAQHLEKICPQIDFLISMKNNLIIELEEYKKSLIYEYITGKKAVL